ncbi:AIPR protein [Aequorivita sublithincola DSM 14238]|uniref:AIPR protein n=1 Tax=Aequorivita sublithincola (strain DSM 14238 / LMG 21431 / ACAM 643 / 9-3) TaxID=746697 RepID=I3YXQ6_AEQSU|nr:AIPR family protein [Aequorivita sublithincola]AFL81774.1 AIPR protein [Aequorivita sublithincola DSM 14238]
MDRITESLITELLSNLEINSEDESKDFEKLANYTVVSNEYNKTFDIETLTVGDGNDTGIDGIAIIVNGQLVESTDEVDDLLEKNNSLEIEYLFVQSKTSPSFEGADIGTFLFGVLDFFATNPKLVRNEDIKKFAEVSNYIINKAPRFRENPSIKLFYITTGKWMDDANLKGVIENGTVNLEQTNLFEKVTFHPFGARELATAYRKTKETISTTINFNNRITLPKINGVSQAYIGLLPFSEFLKIVSDSEDNILNVFEDNVRDFQGDNNDVNGGIALTLNNEDSEIFSVLNNGVTIVASSISPTGDQFTISDYQIVNGCQTSNVLYNNRKSGNIGKVGIPIKLIATNDDEIKTRITLATNNQTPIKKEQLAALTQFQRSLEQYYNSYTGDAKIYYERRAKQYNSDNNVLKSKVITVPYQIKSFAAMFLDEPHNVTSFFGTIVKRLNEGKAQIFNNDHSYAPYYTSAFAFYKLESFFRKGSIDSSFKKVRFHILMLFRIISEKENQPPLNNHKKMEKFCSELLLILNDETKALKAFKKCTDIIENSGFDKSDRQNLKVLQKTKILIDYAKK